MGIYNPWFSVCYRNPGHWDVSSDGGRWFRIRGRPGEVTVFDERKDDRPYPRETLRFRSVATAFAWIVDEIMIPPEGQEVKP
jgi:hypothetical protein